MRVFYKESQLQKSLLNYIDNEMKNVTKMDITDDGSVYIEIDNGKYDIVYVSYADLFMVMGGIYERIEKAMNMSYYVSRKGLRMWFEDKFKDAFVMENEYIKTISYKEGDKVVRKMEIKI